MMTQIAKQTSPEYPFEEGIEYVRSLSNRRLGLIVDVNPEGAGLPSGFSFFVSTQLTSLADGGKNISSRIDVT